jgi:putative ABC transport system substrate-binding protein
MKLPRRRFLHLTVGSVALSSLPRMAMAENIYPSRPIHFIVGFPPGAASDLLARMIAKDGAPAVGQPIVVENKPGAGGSIAAQFVARAANDGYTLFLPALSTLTNEIVNPAPSFDMSKYFAPVALLASGAIEQDDGPSPGFSPQVRDSSCSGACQSIPIVFGLGSDPVKDGLVASLGRPGSNITGATFFANLLNAKRLGLLHQLVPESKIVATLLNPENANIELEKRDTQAAARALGLELVIVKASTAREIDDSVASVFRQHAGALLVSGDSFLLNQADQIAKLGMRYVLPTCFAFREAAAAGGLMSYGADRSDTWRQVGNYVGRILKGEKPGELPVQQPTKFEFVINLKTAKALGLTVPPNMLLLADDVIE